jgi:DNA polymerase-3 subunit delta
MPATPIKPVYVLYGDDDHLREEHRRRIVQEVVGEADSQLAVSSFDAEASLAEVLDDLRTLPLMAPRRLVVVRDADSFVTANRPALEQYLDRPSATGTLLLMVRSWPSGTNLAKKAAKIGQAFDCSASAVGGLDRWVRQAAQKRKNPIESQAVAMLLELVGPDLALLEAEVEKLSLYAGPGATISAQHVNLLTAAVAEPERFAVENALTAGDARAALQALDKTLTRRGLEFLVLGGIGSYLRRAIQGQSLRQAGGDPAAVLPFNIPSPARRAFLDLLNRRPLRKLQDDSRRVLAADLALKSGAEPRATMQDLLLALCV